MHVHLCLPEMLRERCSKLFQEKGRRISVLLNLKGLKSVSDEELQELKERRHSLSTLKATKWGVKTFQGRLCTYLTVLKIMKI